MESEMENGNGNGNGRASFSDREHSTWYSVCPFVTAFVVSLFKYIQCHETETETERTWVGCWSWIYLLLHMHIYFALYHTTLGFYKRIVLRTGMFFVAPDDARHFSVLLLFLLSLLLLLFCHHCWQRFISYIVFLISVLVRLLLFFLLL